MEDADSRYVRDEIFEQQVIEAALTVARFLRSNGLHKHFTVYMQGQGLQIVAGIGQPGAATPLYSKTRAYPIQTDT